MTNLEKALVGLVVLLLAVVGIRYGRSRMVADPRPGPVAKAMNLEVTVRGGDFTLTIRNTEAIYYVGCLAIIDREYKSPPFTLGPVRLNEVRVHLSDFTKDERRYQWQERSPQHVEVACARYRVVPQEFLNQWGAIDHSKTPMDFSATFFDRENQDPRWPWGDRARWVGGPF